MLIQCHEVAEGKAQETSHYLRRLLAENKELGVENERLAAALADMEHDRDQLRDRVADLERQAEARKFNPELKKQNEKLLSENEAMRTERKKDLDWREATTKKDIYDSLRHALNERDLLSQRFGTQNEWVRMLDLMRNMFRKMPDLTQAIDELLEKHLSEPAPQQGMTVNNPQNCNFVEQQNII